MNKFFLYPNLSLNSQNSIEQQNIYFSKAFLVFIRPLMFISLTCLLTIWYTETRLGQISVFNEYAYPIMTLFLAFNLLFSYQHKCNIELVTLLFFIAFNTYFIVDYYYIFIYLEVIGETSYYNLASMSQWLPMAYIGAFLFLNLKNALLYSIFFALCLFLPELFCFNKSFSHSEVAHNLTFNLFLSHPVYICTLWGVSHLKMMSFHARNNAKTMYELSKIDSLTNIDNRRGCNHQLTKVLAEHRRGITNFSLILIDIDHFKIINDTYGHQFGDEVLKQVAQTLKNELRIFDSLGRWGGEEFIVIVRHDNFTLVSEIAERLRKSITKLTFTNKELKLSASFGITHCNSISHKANNEDILHSLIAMADHALYKAKDAGRNKVCVY